MNIAQIINLIKSDGGLTDEQKEELLSPRNQDTLKSLLSGAAGTVIFIAAAKYMKLAKPAQIALGVLGFGVGSLINNYMNRERFANYNPEHKVYEIDTNKF